MAPVGPSPARPGRLLAVVGCAATLSLGGAWPVAASGPPAVLHCGSVVTSDVRLTSDLTGCPGDGLVAGADGVTIDLAGHTVAGDGVAGDGRFDTGIVVQGRRGVRVTGGTLTRFDRGILLLDATWVDVTRVALVGNAVTGISVRATTEATISRSAARDNTDVGFLVTQGSTGIRLLGNTAEGNEQAITLDGVDGNVVLGNRWRHDDMVVIGDDNRVVGNTATDITGCGPDCGGYGISLEGGSRNLIAGNHVRNTPQDGIRVSSFIPGLTTRGNVVRGNDVRGAGLDGIAVATTGEADPPTGTVVERNAVRGSAGDGIHVAEPGAVVARNLVVGNASHGIEAVAGVVDGGHNRAVGNGLGCVVIRCD